MAPIPDPDSPNDMLNHEYSKYKLNFNGYLGHRQLDPEKPAPTVTARGDNKGGVVILPSPKRRAENVVQRIGGSSELSSGLRVLRKSQFNIPPDWKRCATFTWICSCKCIQPVQGGMRCVYERLYSTETIPGFQMEMGVSTMHGRIE